MKMDFPKKTVSRENDENLGDSELSEDNRKEEKDYSVRCVEAYFRGMETLSVSDEESEQESGSSSKRKRYSTEEKGKAKIENESSPTEIIDIEDELALLNSMMLSLVATNEESDSNLEKEGTRMNEFQRTTDWKERRLREAKRRRYEIARSHAHRLANPQEDGSFSKEKKKGVLKEADEESQDFGGGPFHEAMVMIKKRDLVQELKWMPAENKDKVGKCGVPSLLDLSLKALAKNAEAIVSLELVPDFLRHRLRQIVCKKRKMDAHFLELLASGSPTEIRLNDGSGINIEDFTRIFGACDKKNLIVSDFTHYFDVYYIAFLTFFFFLFFLLFSLGSQNQGPCWPSFLKFYGR